MITMTLLLIVVRQDKFHVSSNKEVQTTQSSIKRPRANLPCEKPKAQMITGKYREAEITNLRLPCLAFAYKDDGNRCQHLSFRIHPSL
jgi:hypothetical protein